MIRFRAGQRRLVRGAPVGGQPAPGREPAAVRRRTEVGRDAGDVEQLAGPVLAELRDRGQQRLGVRVAHVPEQRAGAGCLHQPARVHHVDPVGVPGDHPHVVGDENHRHPESGLEVVQQVQDLCLNRDVERGRRLVRDQDPRLAGQRHRDHDPLPQAARELVRVVVEALGRPRQPDQAEHLQGPRAGRLPGRVPVQRVRLGDLVADGLRRVQGRQRVLEDHRDLVAADLAQFVLGQADELALTQLDRAADDLAAGRQQVHDRQPGHGLAAAGLAHQAERLAGVQVQVDVPDGLDGGLADVDVGGQVGDVEDTSHGGAPHSYLDDSGTMICSRLRARRRTGLVRLPLTMSLSASPTWRNATTTMTSTISGGYTCHQ